MHETVYRNVASGWFKFSASLLEAEVSTQR
jgi:hypothetical protein